MPAVDTPSALMSGLGPKPFLPALGLILALASVLLPTWYIMAKEVWPNEEQAHGPIILLVSAYLVWQERQAFRDGFAGPIGYRYFGWISVIGSALIFFVGWTQQILFFGVLGQIGLLMGSVLILLGARGLRRLWFPLVFLFFMIPLPGFIVDQLTSSLKLVVSQSAAFLMHSAGLPIARDGVLLQIGQYKLLVADACSGLYSLISLSALGVLYMWLIRSSRKARNIVLFLSIFPIAIAANIIRVVALSLITYYFGDGAGQGFLHGFAGMTLFIAALSLIILFDGLVRVLLPDRQQSTGVSK